MSWMKMKHKSSRLIAVFAALTLVFAVACGDDDNGDDSNGNTNNMSDAGDVGDDDGGDGGGLGPCEELDPAFADGTCDPLCQTGCEDDEACVAGVTEDDQRIEQCVPEGDGTQGDACNVQSETDQCAPGYLCLPEDESGNGSCLKYCRADDETIEPQCDSPDAECQPMTEDDDRLGVCIVPADDECEPYPEEDECGDGETCWFNSQGNQCVTFDSDAEAGDSCNAGSDCNDQQSCIQLQGEDAPQCRQHCDPEGDDCRDGFACAGLVAEEGGDPMTFVCLEDDS